MSEATGLTEQDEIVVDGDDDGDGGDGSDGGDGGSQDQPPSKIGGDIIGNTTMPEYTDRHEYTITREGGDPFGNPKSIEYKNGESVELLYDNQGGLTAVVDTASGTRMIKTEEGWMLENKNGDRSKIDGDVTVDSSTGAVITKLNNGTTVTANPDGRVVATNADGKVLAVSLDQPGNIMSGLNQGAYKGFSGAQYDANNNLVGATDEYGNQYVKSESGWRMVTRDGSSVALNGTVQADQYGLRVVPNGKLSSGQDTPPEQPIADPEP